MGGNARKCICLLVLIATSCSGVSERDLQHLAGYWEIREVVFPDGNNKEFIASPMVDYFSLEGRSGYRKKLQPMPDGTFETSDDALPLEVITRNGEWLLRYTGDEGSWEETIEALSGDRLLLRDPSGVKYRYTKFQPNLKTVSDGS